MVNPKPALRERLDNRDLHLPVLRRARVFGRLIAALFIACIRCWVDMMLRGEMGG